MTPTHAGPALSQEAPTRLGKVGGGSQLCRSSIHLSQECKGQAAISTDGPLANHTDVTHPTHSAQGAVTEVTRGLASCAPAGRRMAATLCGLAGQARALCPQSNAYAHRLVFWIATGALLEQQPASHLTKPWRRGHSTATCALASCPVTQHQLAQRTRCRRAGPTSPWPIPRPFQKVTHMTSETYVCPGCVGLPGTTEQWCMESAPCANMHCSSQWQVSQNEPRVRLH